MTRAVVSWKLCVDAGTRHSVDTSQSDAAERAVPLATQWNTESWERTLSAIATAGHRVYPG